MKMLRAEALVYVCCACWTYTRTILPFRFASAQSRPPADASQDITSTAAVVENGVTTVFFTRQRVTNDSNDVSLDQCVYFLYAWGGTADFNTQVIGYHGDNRESSDTMICLPSPSVCPGEWNADQNDVDELGLEHVLCVLSIPRLILSCSDRLLNRRTTTRLAPTLGKGLTIDCVIRNNSSVNDVTIEFFAEDCLVPVQEHCVLLKYIEPVLFSILYSYCMHFNCREV